MKHFTCKPCENFKTNIWSGGTTTELFIFPATANYQQRDFDFRISTARVETEESEFTALPGFLRKLMVLDGAVTLYHAGHYSKGLSKFEVDEFKGYWKTTSKGKCIDFNLMTKPGVEGNISGKTMWPGEKDEWQMVQKSDWFFLYLFSGEVEISYKGENALMKKGDFVSIENPLGRNLTLKAFANSDIVFTEVSFKAP